MREIDINKVYNLRSRKIELLDMRNTHGDYRLEGRKTSGSGKVVQIPTDRIRELLERMVREIDQELLSVGVDPTPWS